MNWQQFIFTPYQYLYPQIQFYCYSPSIYLGKDDQMIFSSQKQILPLESNYQNTYKIQLTQQDLRKQSYQSHKKVWAQQQDKRLVYLYEKKKLNWQQIAEKIPGRNKKMCYSRYRRLQSGTRIQWTKQDNFKLNQLVLQNGQNWKIISQHFQNRNPKQIKEHYKNYVRPDIDKSQWCFQDDIKLIELINKHGKNWKIIEQTMSNRSLNQIKNRYFGKLKKLNDKIYGQNEQN